MAFAHDPAQWWRKYVLGYEGLAPRSAGGARRHGTLVHEILEQCGGELSDLDEVITGVLSRHGLEGEADGDGASVMTALRETLRAMVQTAASHPTWLALSAEPSMRQELPFVRILSDGSTVEGAMDLVARTAEGVAIVDVKTGALGAPTASRAASGTSAPYALQAATYRDAVSAITGVASDAVSFTLLSTVGGGGTMTPPIDAGEPAATITALRGWTGTG
jgi:RecB family exonuclease